MKNYKFLSTILILIMIFSLVSCKEKDSHQNSHQGHNNNTGVVNPNTEDDDVEQSGGEGYVTYYYSVLAKTLHLGDCYHVKEIKEEYLKTTKQVAHLLEDGYTFCRVCLIPDDDTDTEDKEDDTNKVAKEDATYVINSSLKTLHELDCSSVKEMKEKNIQYTDLTLEELIELDIYKPCKNCLPDEAKEYYEKHPELNKK